MVTGCSFASQFSIPCTYKIDARKGTGSFVFIAPLVRQLLARKMENGAVNIPWSYRGCKYPVVIQGLRTMPTLELLLYVIARFVMDQLPHVMLALVCFRSSSGPSSPSHSSCMPARESSCPLPGLRYVVGFVLRDLCPSAFSFSIGC